MPTDTQSDNKTSKITLPDLDSVAMGTLEDEDTIAEVLKARERTTREVL